MIKSNLEKKCQDMLNNMKFVSQHSFQNDGRETSLKLFKKPANMNYFDKIQNNEITLETNEAMETLNLLTHYIKSNHSHRPEEVNYFLDDTPPEILQKPIPEFPQYKKQNLQGVCLRNTWSKGYSFFFIDQGSVGMPQQSTNRGKAQSILTTSNYNDYYQQILSMFKARKLGPQSYMDFIRDEIPTESTTITKKDQTYWNNKNQFFSKIAFTQQKANEQRNFEQLHKFKYESQLRLKRNEFKRNILEIKSKQKSSEASKFVVTDEDLNLPLYQRSPTHLDNSIDNQWNHLELLDRKHLKQIYGPKTFNRQKKAISQIDNNFQADIELQKMKLQAQVDFRNKLLKHKSLQASQGTAKGLEISFLRQVRPEYKGMLLLNMTTIEQYHCPTLYSHLRKLDCSTSIQTRSKQQSTKNVRSKSINTTQTEMDEQTINQKVYNEMNETLQKFEITLKERCQYLQK